MVNYANFIKDYTDLFTPDVIKEAETFFAKRNPPELKELNVLAKRLRYILSKTTDDKQRQAFLNKLEEIASATAKIKEQNPTPDFPSLSYSARHYLCTVALVNKYMIQEAAQHSNQAKDVKIPSKEAFINSQAYQILLHIKDYIGAYITHNHQLVDNWRYFINLHKDCKRFEDFEGISNAYFDSLKSGDIQTNRVEKSHEGIEVVMTLPEYNLQLVRLLTKKALDYEGNVMDHCVGRGSYDDDVESGRKKIYSVRNCGEPDQELVPHVTIEVVDGKIRQVKGLHNGLIEPNYIEATRKFVKFLGGSKNSIKELGLSDGDMKNLGFYKTTTGEYCDICLPGEDIIELSSVQSDDFILAILPPERICCDSLTLKGSVTEKTLDFIQRFHGVEHFCLDSCEFEKGAFADQEVLPSERIRLKTLTLSGAITKETLGFIQHFYGYSISFDSCTFKGDSPEHHEFSLPEKIYCHTLSLKGPVTKLALDFIQHLSNCKSVCLDSCEFENGAFADQEVLPSERIHCKKLTLKGAITKETFDFIQRFYGYSISFNSCTLKGEFSEHHEFSLPEEVRCDSLSLEGSITKEMLNFVQYLRDCKSVLLHSCEFESADFAHQFLSSIHLDNQGYISFANCDFNTEPLDLSPYSFNHINFHNKNLTSLVLPETCNGLEITGAPLQQLDLKNVKYLWPEEQSPLTTLPETLEDILLRCPLDFNGFRLPNLSQVNCASPQEDVDFSRFQKLAFLKLTGVGPSMQTLDLSQNSSLNELLLESSFDNLESIVIPASIKWVNLSCLDAPHLRELDLRAYSSPIIGKDSIRYNAKSYNSSKYIDVTGYGTEQICGVDLSRAKMPALETILFPKNVEEIYLPDLKTEHLNVDFSKYPHLRILTLGKDCKCTPNCLKSLQKCQSLRRFNGHIFHPRRPAIPPKRTYDFSSCISR